ncbi:MAG: ferritin [Candidatus Gastranaerophilaceae bacterium]
MLNEKIVNALNKQINEELFSAYLYMSMSSYCSSVGLEGFAHWMNIQQQEELFHSTKLYNYVINRGGRAILETIVKPQSEWKEAVDIIEAAKKHEHHITGCINSLITLSLEENDHATASFLKWFIDEQVEEEANVEAVLNKFKLTKNDSTALFIIDKELSTRVLNLPVDPNAKA